MNKWWVVGAVLILIAGVGLFFWFQKQKSLASINSYEECVNAGLPVLDSYPPQCKAPNGKTFTQNIGNELQYHDEILVSSPRPNQQITSPLSVSGQAKGNWYSEGSFSGELFDSNNKSLGTVVLTANGDWMSENFVSFTGNVTFEKPTTVNGTLILKNANPSGDPTRDKKLTIPVKF